MKNTKLRRILLLLACAVLLVSLSVGATLAYLTSTTETVTNTFTVGKVSITLDELDVDEYGKKIQVEQKDEDGNTVTDEDGNTIMEDSTARVTANQYKLIPGHSYFKDPTVHVAADSEEGYLFVKVVNGIEAIEDNTNTIAAQMATKKWVALGDGYPNIYYYNGGKVSAGNDIVVFDTFTIDADATETTLDQYKTASITVQAYMVQSDGIASATAAYTSAPCSAWTTTTDSNADSE